MRNISFAMTTKQIQDRSKIVTRRFGWWNLKQGDRLLPVKKAMGLKKGETIQPLLPDGVHIIIVNTRTEPLDSITKEDCILEGFPNLSPSDFVDMLVKVYKCDRSKPVNRIQFAYSDADNWIKDIETPVAIASLVLAAHSRLKQTSLFGDN